jgi:hypothetical protein
MNADFERVLCSLLLGCSSLLSDAAAFDAQI